MSKFKHGFQPGDIVVYNSDGVDEKPTLIIAYFYDKELLTLLLLDDDRFIHLDPA